MIIELNRVMKLKNMRCVVTFLLCLVTILVGCRYPSQEGYLPYNSELDNGFSRFQLDSQPLNNAFLSPRISKESSELMQQSAVQGFKDFCDYIGDDGRLALLQFDETIESQKLLMSVMTGRVYHPLNPARLNFIPYSKKYFDKNLSILSPDGSRLVFLMLSDLRRRHANEVKLLKKYQRGKSRGRHQVLIACSYWL